MYSKTAPSEVYNPSSIHNPDPGLVRQEGKLGPDKVSCTATDPKMQRRELSPDTEAKAISQRRVSPLKGNRLFLLFHRVMSCFFTGSQEKMAEYYMDQGIEAFEKGDKATFNNCLASARYYKSDLDSVRHGKGGGLNNMYRNLQAIDALKQFHEKHPDAVQAGAKILSDKGYTELSVPDIEATVLADPQSYSDQAQLLLAVSHLHQACQGVEKGDYSQVPQHLREASLAEELMAKTDKQYPQGKKLCETISHLKLSVFKELVEIEPEAREAITELLVAADQIDQGIKEEMNKKIAASSVAKKARSEKTSAERWATRKLPRSGWLGIGDVGIGKSHVLNAIKNTMPTVNRLDHDNPIKKELEVTVPTPDGWLDDCYKVDRLKLDTSDEPGFPVTITGTNNPEVEHEVSDIEKKVNQAVIFDRLTKGDTQVTLFLNMRGRFTRSDIECTFTPFAKAVAASGDPEWYKKVNICLTFANEVTTRDFIPRTVSDFQEIKSSFVALSKKMIRKELEKTGKMTKEQIAEAEAYWDNHEDFVVCAGRQGENVSEAYFPSDWVYRLFPARDKS